MSTPLDQAGRPRPWLMLSIALAPTLVAVWVLPWFVTQDGPAHLYNGRIINAALVGNSPYASAFTVRARPLPNWAGHLLSMGMDALLPPRTAEKMLTSLTLLAVAAACLRLRLRVVGLEGPREARLAAVYSAVVGLNLTWLLGFTSFLLGTTVFALTLAEWWGNRDASGARPVLRLTLLLALGYFCHPISLGLTAFSLGFLALFTTPSPRRSLSRLIAAGLPLIPLGLYYLSQTKQGGGMSPVWESLANPLSLSSWKTQLGWVDPITFAGKSFRPFSTVASGWNAPFGPTLWLLAALGLILASGRSTSRAWGALALTLILVGIVSPDTLGVSHGHYMPQRLVLLGLIALLPALPLSGGRFSSAGGIALCVALGLQTAWVWDYGLESSRKVGSLMAAAPEVGRGKRVGTVLADARNRFRVNPMLHSDCFLGINTGNVIWTNYETNHYYFPVQLKNREASPVALEFENVSKMVSPDQDAERARLWGELLRRSRSSIDVIVSWGDDPILDRINASYFASKKPLSDGKTRVWSGPAPYGTNLPELDSKE